MRYTAARSSRADASVSTLPMASAVLAVPEAGSLRLKGVQITDSNVRYSQTNQIQSMIINYQNSSINNHKQSINVKFIHKFHS